MKRWPVKIAVLLVLGAVVNGAVAWGYPKLRWLVTDMMSGTPKNRQPVTISSGTVGSSVVPFLEFAQFGWPCVAYNGAGHLCVVGFAANSVFYAGILGLLFVVPGEIRRWRCIKRRLCLTCAYPIGASEVCTECGARVGGPST